MAKTQKRKPSHTLSLTFSKGKAFGYCACGAYIGFVVIEDDGRDAPTLVQRHTTHVNAAVERERKEKLAMRKATPKRPAKPKEKAAK